MSFHPQNYPLFIQFFRLAALEKRKAHELAELEPDLVIGWERTDHPSRPSTSYSPVTVHGVVVDLEENAVAYGLSVKDVNDSWLAYINSQFL